MPECAFVLVTVESVSLDELKAAGKQPPKSLRSSASDAYLLFQVSLVLSSLANLLRVAWERFLGRC